MRFSLLPINPNKKDVLWVVICIAGLISACNRSEEHVIQLPSNFQLEYNIPERNPLTKDGIELGRMLFYDPVLSENGKVSCSSCHRQELAFTDGLKVSINGVTGEPVERNSPTLANLLFNDHFFWDGGAGNLESLSFAPLMHVNEMGIELKTLTNKLNNHPQYRSLFKKAFGVDSVRSADVVRALAQFQRILISTDSRYDQWVRSEDKGLLSGAEKRGLDLFTQHCAGCHTPPLFTDDSFHNNGLDSLWNYPYEDPKLGRFRITLDSADLGKFKTPTLRNIMLTAPYMHDGRFSDIRGVIDHYSQHVRSSPSLDPLLQNSIILDSIQREELILFLETLTDENFTNNPEYSNPF